MASEPKTLQGAILHFADSNNCIDYLAARRWKNGVVCPTCGSKDVAFVSSRSLWQCKTRHPKSQFSIKVGTIFEDSPITLDKWLLAMWMLANYKNGISSYEISRVTGISQKSTWFMLQRIRLAMQGQSAEKLSGEVEADETFIGGKARNKHKAKRERVITGTGGKDKTVVMGIMARGGNVRAIDNRKKKTVQNQVREHVEAGAAVFSDELKSYEGLSADYQHAVVNHAIEYVDGNTPTRWRIFGTS
jgi:transposase-like protein